MLNITRRAILSSTASARQDARLSRDEKTSTWFAGIELNLTELGDGQTLHHARHTVTTIRRGQTTKSCRHPAMPGVRVAGEPNRGVGRRSRLPVVPPSDR